MAWGNNNELCYDEGDEGAVVLSKKFHIRCVNIPIKMWVYISIPPFYDPQEVSIWRIAVYPHIPSSTALLIVRKYKYIEPISTGLLFAIVI